MFTGFSAFIWFHVILSLIAIVIAPSLFALPGWAAKSPKLNA
jgi:hypothetical protein